jgi:hypothetical protein
MPIMIPTTDIKIIEPIPIEKPIPIFIFKLKLSHNPVILFELTALEALF